MLLLPLPSLPRESSFLFRYHSGTRPTSPSFSVLTVPTCHCQICHLPPPPPPWFSLSVCHCHSCHLPPTTTMVLSFSPLWEDCGALRLAVGTGHSSGWHATLTLQTWSRVCALNSSPGISSPALQSQASGSALLRARSTHSTGMLTGRDAVGRSKAWRVSGQSDG